MRTLGAVLAGGRSRRFGSDKAEAILNGRTLLDHAEAALREQCSDIIIVGRSAPLLTSVEDWPRAAMGPLGGLAGALRYASEHDYARVLSIPVDCIWLPPDLMNVLDPAPACVANQPVIGLWPADAHLTLETMLSDESGRAVRDFAKRIGARFVSVAFAPPNINTPGDLEQISQSRGQGLLKPE